MNGIAVTVLLVPLAFFKYYGFLAVNVTNVLGSLGLESSIPLIQVVLPVGHLVLHLHGDRVRGRRLSR